MTDYKQELLKILFMAVWIYRYKWYIIKWYVSKEWKYFDYKIYNKQFRMLYNWCFHSTTYAMKFIDHYNNLLSNLSNLKINDKYSSEYFIWWYNYYGELIG